MASKTVKINEDLSLVIYEGGSEIRVIDNSADKAYVLRADAIVDNDIKQTDLKSVFGSTTHLIPAADITYDLGSSDKRWRDLYLSNNTMYLGNVSLSTNVSTGTISTTTYDPDDIPDLNRNYYARHVVTSAPTTYRFDLEFASQKPLNYNTDIQASPYNSSYITTRYYQWVYYDGGPEAPEQYQVSLEEAWNKDDYPNLTDVFFTDQLGVKYRLACEEGLTMSLDTSPVVDEPGLESWEEKWSVTLTFDRDLEPSNTEAIEAGQNTRPIVVDNMQFTGGTATWKFDRFADALPSSDEWVSNALTSIPKPTVHWDSVATLVAATPVGDDKISLSTLKSIVAASVDFADFQARIAAL